MKSLLLRVVILPSNILPQALDPSRSPRGFQVQGGACKTDRFHGKNIRSQPRLSHLKLRPYPPIFDMKTVAKDLSLSIHLWCESTTFTADYYDCLLWKYSFDKRSYDWLFGQRENIVWAECALRQPFWQIIKPHAFWSRLPSYFCFISIGSRNAVLDDDNDQHAQVWQLLTFLLFVATWVDILARVSAPILSLTSITALLLTLRLKSQNY